jgi:protein-disulfide isomerase
MSASSFLPRAAVLALVGATLALAAPAARAQGFTAQQKAEFGALVKDYLVRNPEVIQEALVELEKRQKDAEKTAMRQTLSELSGALVNSPRNIVLGNPQGDVTLVEFFDYNCGYCKRSLTDLRELIKADPRLRVVIRDFPVLGQDSVEASFVAVAAKQQIKPERYFEFHQKLLESKGRVGKERAIQVAKEFGVDAARLTKDLDSPDVRAAVEETMQMADALKLQGTPAFVVGDEIIFGAVGTDPLRKAVAAVRQCGKATC